MVTININNKNLYLIIAIFVFLVGAGVVVAYNTNPANPAMMGHSADEIELINDFGSPISLEQYINDQISSVNGVVVCDSTPIYDYSAGGKGVGYMMPAYNYNEGIRDIPAVCKTEAGCVIKEEVYNSKSSTRPVVIRKYDFVQYSTGKWWSSSRPAGDAVNGDTTSTDVILAYGSDSLGRVYLRDDYVYKTVTVEKNPDKWTFIDRSKSYGMKVYICSYNIELD